MERGQNVKPLSKYNKKTILSEELFIEIFEQEDEIMKARMLLSCRDKAKELGVAKNFDDLVSAYRKVEKSMQKQTVTRSLLENWTLIFPSSCSTTFPNPHNLCLTVMFNKLIMLYPLLTSW